MRFATISAVAAAFAAVGLLVVPVAAADEETFLKTLEVGGFSWAGDGQPLVDLGHEICAGMSSGTSAADIITEGSRELGWTPT